MAEKQPGTGCGFRVPSDPMDRICGLDWLCDGCRRHAELQNRPQTSDAPSRDDKGRLLPGSTANPGGRPKRVKEIEDEIVATFGPRAADVMTALYEKAARGNVRAAEVFLDRVLGKARVRAELSGPGGGPIEHTEDLSRLTSGERRRRIMELWAKASGGPVVAAGDAGGPPAGPQEVAPAPPAQGGGDASEGT